MAKITVIPQRVNPLTHIPNNSPSRKRVAAYARVSTKQEDQANSYEAQIDYYTKLIGGRPDWMFAGMYADKGITGTSRKHRVEFNRMIDDAMAGKIDMIILKSVTRFARNTLDTVGLARQLRERGVEVVFEEENISNFDPNGELNLTIRASIAQEESRNISQNVKWGKHKRYRDGITSVAYKNFLGYDKHPTDPKKGFVVNEEQAKIVRLIYKKFMMGKTTSWIANFLQENGYKTPAGKDKWQLSTIESILTNEKYKGDAHIRKSYVKDFLTHELVKNQGEAESWYVEEHHEPIINPEEWELVQAELKRRKELRFSYNCANTFSSKLVCADCGKFYGAKVWHSTSKYRRVVYQCNGKFDKGHEKCETPVFTEDEIKDRFMRAYAAFMGDRIQIVEDCRTMVDVVCSTEGIAESIAKLESKAADYITLAEKLIERQSTEAMPHDEFMNKYDGYDRAREKLLKEIQDKQSEMAFKQAKAKSMEAFIKDLERRPGVLEQWDEDVWCYLIDSAKVNRDKTITFVFRNGSEITK